jgi:hypothetical protein
LLYKTRTEKLNTVRLMANNVSFCEHCGMITYLDGLHPDRHLRQAKVNALGELQSPSRRFGDGSQSALMPSVLDRAFKGEL